jgi:hypothetical protein
MLELRDYQTERVADIRVAFAQQRRVLLARVAR